MTLKDDIRLTFRFTAKQDWENEINELLLQINWADLVSTLLLIPLGLLCCPKFDVYFKPNSR